MNHMAADQTFQHKFEHLRDRAKELLQKDSLRTFNEPSDFLETINELKIYQAELEIQNEELQRAQMELSELQQEYANLYEFAPCGYLTLNATGAITKINLTGSRLLACPRSLLQYKIFSSFIAEDKRSAFLDAIAICGKTETKQSLELPLNRENEAPLWVRVEVEADRDGYHEVKQWRVVILDISAQKQAEKEKQKIEKELRQAQKMESLGTMAGGIAHEFNNILFIILGYCDLLLTDRDKSRVKKGLEEIRIAGLRGRDVIRQLLLFSRNDDVQQARVALNSTLLETIKLIRPTVSTNIEIELNIDDDVKPICGNTTQINQLLINLCSNAADAIVNKNGKINISLCNTFLPPIDIASPSTPTSKYVKLTVSDNGVGMNKKTLSRMFEPYFTTKDTGKGTGIGLAVVHGIVESHNGIISVESQPGNGTTFTILFPINEGNIEQSTEAITDFSTGHERILYVDDDNAILKVGKQLLERLGYTVTEFSEPVKALATYSSNPDAFDIVITDMEMPDLTGDRLITEILRIRPGIPTVLYTGYSERMTQEKALELGASQFLLKPINKENLATTIRKALDEAYSGKTCRPLHRS